MSANKNAADAFLQSYMMYTPQTRCIVHSGEGTAQTVCHAELSQN